MAQRSMVIRNSKVFTKDGIFKNEDIYIKNGVFADINTRDEGDTAQIDGTNLLAIPGLVDIHFHGAIGYDFCEGEKEALKAILDYELSHGVMAVCPTTMTFPEEIIGRAVDSALELSDGDSGADIVGINLEGPFINPQKAAAQNPDYVRKGDPAMLQRLLERGRGLIKIVDVSPEIKENFMLIEEFKDKVNFSVAHTMADYDIAGSAFRAGAKQLTHMFNAMPEIMHRSPGPELAALEEGAYVELISDGVHNHDAIIRMVFGLYDSEKAVLISDSMMATGLKDGLYSLGGQKVMVKGRECRLKDNPDTIAGSNSNLFECLKHTVLEAGVPLEKAVLAATINPARAIGVDDKYGSIREGRYGNVILMDEELNIKYIIKNGCIK